VAGRVVESMGWDAPAPLVWSAGERVALPTRGPSVPRWTPHRAEAVLASTTVELDDLVRRGVPRDRTHCVPLRVWPSVAELNQPIGTRVRVRRVCCLLDDDSSGALAMVRALSRLPSMRLLVVGREGVDRSRSSARDVALLARHLHVDGRVGVLTDASESALELAMRQADVVALLSPLEPDVGALGAALVSGAVPVVLAGTGAEEVVEHGVSGVCVRTLDPRQLGSALRILDQDPDVRDTMAIAARRRAREIYEPDILARACVETYRVAQRSRIPGASPARASAARGLEVSA
jgi:D-inositol-3-phosphate glycosyltransferase